MYIVIVTDLNLGLKLIVEPLLNSLVAGFCCYIYQNKIIKRVVFLYAHPLLVLNIVLISPIRLSEIKFQIPSSLQSILPPSMSEFQRLRCRVAFHALQFRPKIRILGRQMVERYELLLSFSA